MTVQCYRCGKYLCNEQSLFYHLNKKTKCSSLKCAECNVMFKTKLEMRLHKCGKSPVKNVPSPPKIKKPDKRDFVHQIQNLEKTVNVVPDYARYVAQHNNLSTQLTIENNGESSSIKPDTPCLLRTPPEKLNENLSIFLDSIRYQQFKLQHENSQKEELFKSCP